MILCAMVIRADEELVSPQEIAERLGLANHRVVLEWRFRRPDFPAPATRRRTYLWRWSDVAAWQREHEDELAVLRIKLHE